MLCFRSKWWLGFAFYSPPSEWTDDPWRCKAITMMLVCWCLLYIVPSQRVVAWNSSRACSVRLPSLTHKSSPNKRKEGRKKESNMLQTPPQLEFSLSSLSERDIDINITSAAAGCPTAGYMYIQSTQSSISMGSWTTLEGYGKGRYLDDGCVRSFSCSPAASPFPELYNHTFRWPLVMTTYV